MNTPTICLVDDDEAVQRSLGMLIRSMGFESRGFTSGKEFLDSFQFGACDCLLLDIRLPGEDGLEILSVIYEHFGIFPVIIISGYCDSVDRDRAMELAVFDVIEKPWRTAKLQDLIRRVVGSAGDST